MYLELRKLIKDPTSPLYDQSCLSTGFWSFTSFYDLIEWVEAQWNFSPDIEYAYSNRQEPDGKIENEIFQIIEPAIYGEGGTIRAIVYLQEDKSRETIKRSI